MNKLNSLSFKNLKSLKRTLSLSVICLFTLFIASTISHADEPVSNESPPLNEALAGLFPESCYLSGHFVEQKQLAGLTEPLVSEGQFIFACDRGLSWYTTTPINEALIYSLGKKNFYYSKASGSVEPLTGRLHKNIGKLLVGIMGADFDYIDQYFQLIEEPATNSDRVDQDGDQDKTGALYRFTPRKKAMRKFISELRLQKDDSDSKETADDKVKVDFDQPEVGSTRLIISQVKYFESWSLVECLGALNNMPICETMSTLNKSPEQPYGDHLSPVN